MNKNDVISAFGALAHDHRLTVYRMLVERGPEGISAGVIAERLGVPPSSLTFHLQQLLQAGLVTQRRLSRQVIYAANATALNELIAFLTENCCGREVKSSYACNPSRKAIVAETKRRRIKRSA